MTQQQKADKAKSLMIKLLPPLEYEENEDCAELYVLIDELGQPPSPDSYREALEKILKVATGDVWEPVVTIEEIARTALGKKEVGG